VRAVTTPKGQPRVSVWARAAFGSVLVAAAAASTFVVLSPRGDVLDRPHALPSAALIQPKPLHETDEWTLPLPTPSPPPANAYAAVELHQMGSIQIPAIGLTQPVFDGVWLSVLDVGPGHWPGTAAFGGEGNVVIGGHRVTYGAPFRNLDRLRPGDTIALGSATETYTYRVTSSGVVDPGALWIADQHPGRTLTLFTCHPPGSYRYRYVVKAELVA
jgi:LPXTG-site transpeptidase (sortase) family protein